MSNFQIKIRGSSSQPIAAEYECPAHGRFAIDAQRDANGDAPGAAACPRGGSWGYCAIGKASPYVISGPRVKVRLVEAVRGKDQRAELSTWTDTTSLGEGQDLDDWRADREKVWDAHRQREDKELLR